MAPKGKGAKQTKAPPPRAKTIEPPKEYTTIAEQLQAEYLDSIPYLLLFESKGIEGLTANERQGYAYYRFLETGAYSHYPATQQEEFWKACKKHNVPVPIPKPRDLGRDGNGREIGKYSLKEYSEYRLRQDRKRDLEGGSWLFRERVKQKTVDSERGIEVGEITEQEIQDEKRRRKEIGALRGKAMGRYASDPQWDDIIPVPQEDGPGALAQIAYTDEYSEAMSYLRACMSISEHSPRVLALTEHIITLNAAHYTVWLYRSSTLFSLNSSIKDELTWLNEIALDNQKNYQIWHHRQLLLDHILPSLTDSSEREAFVGEEQEFMDQMFAEDSKNYHVWTYRQYFVRKLELFNEAELASIEALLRLDVRNNSAWSHRFFVVFSDPAYATPGCKATAPDPAIPSEVVDREIEFGKAATFEAPQNQSAWNYIRGVLRKGGRRLASLECFAGEFVKLGGDGEEGEEDVRSSHALDFLADAWVEMGKTEEAERTLLLLGEKYDPIRKNYWDWRRQLLKEGKAVAV